MKEDTNVFCNLCQKSFSCENFKNHLPSVHLPADLHLFCTYCQMRHSSLPDLQLHLNSAHKSDNIIHQVLQFNDLFVSCFDISSHTKKCSEWISKLFSFDLKSILNRKEIRSIIKENYSQISNKLDLDSDCDLCDDDKSYHTHCSYCGQQFVGKCYLKLHVLSKHIVLPDHIKESINLCEACGKTYPNRRTLMQHNRIHLDRGVKKGVKMPQSCNFCNKKLANKSNLNRHVMNKHSQEIGAPLNHNVFTCDYCKCFFSNKSSVKRHIENLHMKTKDTKKSISCFQCEQRFNSIKNLNAHLAIEHNVTINEEKLQFSDLNEFFTWKQAEEIRTNSRFIQLRGLRRQRRKGEEISTLKFVCNRSGIFHSKSNGKRAYRIKGSSKIGRYCSAYIEIMFKDNESVNGIYCSTHSGHDNDLRYLTLTMDEKREIYEKIKSGATFSSILNEIRNNVGKEIKRKHLVTNKDLHNIVTTFKKNSKPNENYVQSETPSAFAGSPNDDDEPSLEEKNDRNFNNDLDLCADLWVDTCQRMVNRFNQQECDTSKAAKVKNNSFGTDIPPQDGYHKTNGFNDDFSRICYASHNNNTASNLLLDTPQQSHTPTNYTNYGNQPVEKFENTIYFDNHIAAAKSSTLKQHAKDFYGISATISDDLRLNKDFYPVTIDNHVPSNAKLASTCCVEYNSINDSQVYSRNDTNVYDKLPNNTYNSCNYADKVLTTSNTESQPLIHSIDDEDASDNDVSCDDVAVSDDEPETSAENKDKQEKFNLRDRVNSVTALYNIVESELDERKKNIIRNYVDNMFRVLQYRYNKCRTKNKQNTSTHKEKKSKNTLQPANKKRKKVPDLIPAQIGTSSDYVSKLPNNTAYTTSLNNSTIGNLAARSDAEFMRWDRY